MPDSSGPDFGNQKADIDYLPYTDDVKAKTDHLYPKVANVIPELEWRIHAPFIAAINDLKKQKNAVILAHNYMTPEIFNCVGDFAGDSLQLAKEAARTDAEIIVQAGVHFMAETSKILCPEKTVLIPDLRAGCSLAASITGEDVRLLKQKYPGAPVVTYVNSTADVKAETDICCTSSNAVEVVEYAAKEFNSDTVLFLPDQYLAKNVAAMTDIKIVTWAGACEVHERFSQRHRRSDRAPLEASRPGRRDRSARHDPGTAAARRSLRFERGSSRLWACGSRGRPRSTHAYTDRGCRFRAHGQPLLPLEPLLRRIPRGGTRRESPLSGRPLDGAQQRHG